MSRAHPAALPKEVDAAIAEAPCAAAATIMSWTEDYPRLREWLENAPKVGQSVQYFHAADRPPLAALVTAAAGNMVQLAVFWPGAAAFEAKKGVEYSSEPQAGCWRWPA